MRHFYILVFSILIASFGFGQVQIYSLDFDGSGSYTTSASENIGSSSDYWGLTNGSNINATFSGSSNSGNNFFAAQDFDGLAGLSSSETITISGINITNYTNLELRIHIAEDDDGSAQDWDGNTELLINYNIDGSGISNGIHVQSVGGTNTEPAIDSDFNGTGDSPLITDSWTQFTYAIIQTGSSMDIEITFSNMDAGDEDIAIDDIEIWGTLASSNPTIGFDSTTSSENETNSSFTSANIPITLTNYGGDQVDIDVSVTGGNAEPGDFTFTSPTPLSFTSDGSQNITVDIEPDADFDDETIELTITETTSGTGLVISQATHTITIIDDDTPTLPNIVINEILADPTGIDANGDSTVSTTQDEFIELVNNDINSIDITGYTLSDALGLKHTFGSVVLPAGGSIVVFGGGSPTGIPGLSVVASSGSLQLNNGGDTVTLENTSNDVIDSYTYGGEGGDDQSLGRSEDLFGSFTKHTEIKANPVVASPGLYNRAGVPFSNLAWKGFVDSDWANSSNWGNGSTPNSGDDILILNVSNAPTLGTSVTVNSVTLNPSSSLVISSSGSLNAGLVKLNSTSSEFSSLILDGTIIGTVEYSRFVNEVGTGAVGTGSNDLISLPLLPSGGQNFDDFLTIGSPVNSAILATNVVGPLTTYAFAPYDNLLQTYSNYTNLSTDALVKGKGYRVATTNGQNLTFTGEVESNLVNISITKPIGGSRWNAIGNPFASYINSLEFLSVNTGVFDPLATAIYGYNSGTYSGTDDTIGNFTIINGDSNSTLNVAPGQGFFVAAQDIDNYSASVGFTVGGGFTDIRTTTGTDDFIENRNTPIKYNLKLQLEGNTNQETSFYFNETSTRGVDIGFDAAIFDAFENADKLYSHLVENNTGRALAIQSLNIDDLAGVTIPIGLNVLQGEQLTFSISNTSLPANINVYLEDNEANTWTLLNTFDYTFTPTTTINGTGRFYLHLSDNALSTPETKFNELIIYADNTNDTVVISAELFDTTTATLYDLQGREVSSNVLDTKLRSQEINVSHLSSGIYIVQVKSETSTQTKKVILK